MRIGIFHASLPEAGRKPGGVEVFVHRLASRLAERGHDVRGFSYSPCPPGAPYDHRQLRPDRFRHSASARMVVVPIRLNRLDTSGLEVLHLNGDDWFYLRRDLPTLRTFYGSAWQEALQPARLRRHAYMAACAPLELLAARLATRAYGITPGHPRFATDGCLPIGAELPDDYIPGQDRGGPPAVLFIGTWEGRKRGRYLFELFQSQIRTRVPDAQLWMISDRCEPAEGVRWFEAPDDREVSSLLARAWVMCLPSTYEAFGIPYLEAMAHGTPVVASPNPGAQHVLDGGKAGLVVEDPELGAALARCLTDRELRASLSTRGRERAAAFAWPRVLEAHEAAYREVSEAGQRRNSS